MKRSLRNSLLLIAAFGLFEFCFIQIIFLFFSPQLEQIHLGIMQNGNLFLWPAYWIYIGAIGAALFAAFSNKWVSEKLVPLLAGGKVVFAFFALLIVAILLFGHPAYGANDDYAMMTISSGLIDGTPDAHLVFSNIIIGSVLKVFYETFPNVNWYSIQLYLALVLSSFTLLAMILGYVRKPLERIICLFLLLIFTLRAFYTINFTTNAILACFAGISLLILTTLFPQDPYKPHKLIWGTALVFLSGLIRFEGFGLVFVLMAPLLFFRVIKPGRKWLVISLSAALVLSAGAYLINKVAYANDPEWGPYLVYNQQRGTISGTPRASGAAADEPLWDSIGWGKSGYALFSNWYFIDNQVFTVDSFKVINSVHANRFNDLQQVKDSLNNLIRENRLEMVASVLVIVYAIFFSSRPAFWRILSSLALLIYSASVIFGITYVSRMPVYMFLPMLLIISFEILGLNVFRQPMNGDESESNCWQAWAASILFVLIFLQANIMGKVDQVNYQRQQFISGFVDEVEAKLAGTENPLVVIQASSVPMEWTSPLSNGALPFRHVPTGWVINSPPYNHVLQQYGITNLIDAVYSRPNVFLLGLADYSVKVYIQDHKDIRTIDVVNDRLEVPNGTKYDWVNLVRLEAETASE